jgi:hypothetical protein
MLVHDVLQRRISRAALLAALTFTGLAAACDDSATEPEEDAPAGGAIVTFAFEGHPADTLRVHVLDSATIAAARAYVATRSGPTIPVGPIRRGAGVDPRYPFHFVPDSVRLADMAMELCDGSPMRTAAAVDSLFAWTGRAGQQSTTYCPWSAYPIAVTDAR